MSTKPYFPNLDASRFFAFLLVFAAHCFITTNEELRSSGIFQGVSTYGKLGFLGLEYFFVLSSFLITYLVLTERENTGHFHVRNFLIRRSLRVWPLYFLVVFAGFVVTGMATRFLHIEMESLPDLQYFLFFLVNFYIINYGTNFLFFLAFLWSISVEEQFYIAWAFLMRFYRKRLFPLLCLLLILTSIAFRLYYLGNNRELYFHTLSALGNFGVGAFVAYMAFYKTSLFRTLQQSKKQYIRLFYIIFIASILLFHEFRKFDFFIVIQRTYYAILFGLFILEQAFAENRFFNPGKVAAFNYLGKISYGLYCYHGIVITLLIKVLEKMEYRQNYWDVFGFFPLIIFTFTVVLSAISYRYFEGWFLQLKKRYDQLLS